MAGEQLLAKAVLTGAMRLAQEEGLLLFYKGLFKRRVVGEQLTRKKLFVWVTRSNVAIEVGPRQLQLPDVGSGQERLQHLRPFQLARAWSRLVLNSKPPPQALAPQRAFKTSNVTLSYRRHEIGI